MKKAIIYARSATRMQFDESKPIQYQLKKCKEYAKENGIEVIQEFKSMGLNINQQYSGLNRILSFASSNEIHTILVTGVDRIGRSVKCMDAVAKWCSRDNKNQLINVTTGKNVPALQLGIMGEFFKDYSEEQVSFDDFLDDLSSEEILELIGEAIYKRDHVSVRNLIYMSNRSLKIYRIKGGYKCVKCVCISKYPLVYLPEIGRI